MADVSVCIFWFHFGKLHDKGWWALLVGLGVWKAWIVIMDDVVCWGAYKGPQFWNGCRFFGMACHCHRPLHILLFTAWTPQQEEASS